MDRDELALLAGVKERLEKLREELPNLSYNEQKQAITAFRAKMGRWQRTAMNLGMFLLSKSIEELEVPEAVDYESKKAIKEYINKHPNATGIDIDEASELFDELCWQRHGTAFNQDTCLRGHLAELREYYHQKRQAAEKKAQAEIAERKRVHLVKSFFGDD